MKGCPENLAIPAEVVSCRVQFAEVVKLAGVIPVGTDILDRVLQIVKITSMFNILLKRFMNFQKHRTKKD